MSKVLLAKGDVVRDRYLVSSILGEGGMGRTYIARDKEAKNDVVLKVLSFSELENWKALELFEREIEVLKNIDYPLIPNYYDNFEAKIKDETLFILVQEYIKGKNLYEIITGGERFQLYEIRNIFRSLLETLDYIHKLNPAIIHRDITPKNIIYSDDKKVFLVDFGAVGKIMENTQAAAMSSTFVGTIGYMPPEQLFGKSSPASDLYSLGATIIFLLTGKQPSDFTLDNMKLDFSKDTDAPRDLINLLNKLIEPDDKKRLNSAKKALNILNDIIIVKPKSEGKEGAGEGNNKLKEKKSRESSPEDIPVDELAEKLFNAVRARDIQYVKRLIEQQVDLDYIDQKTGLAPLHIAAKEDFGKLTKILISNNAKIDIKAAKDGKTPLIVAIEAGNFDIAKILLQNGADINVKYKGKTILHHKSISGDINTIRFLVSKGADVNAYDDFEKTPLEYAYNRKHKEIENFLIEKNAIVNAKTYGSALLYSAIKEENTSYVEKLLSEGAPVNDKLRNDMFPIEMVILEKKPLNIAKLLIENGADVNIKNREGDAPLHFSVKNNNTEAVRLLLESNADVDILDKKRLTPLRHALSNKNYEIIKLLVENGADLNKKYSGKAILHMAVEQNNAKVVKLFLDAEAYADIKEDNSGKTPLQLSYENDFKEIKALLLEYGADDNFEFKVTNKFKNLKKSPKRLSVSDRLKMRISLIKGKSPLIITFAAIMLFLFLCTGKRWLGLTKVGGANMTAEAYPVTSYYGGVYSGSFIGRRKLYYIFKAHDNNVYTGYSYLPSKQWYQYFYTRRNKNKNLIVRYVKNKPAISVAENGWFCATGKYFPYSALIVIALALVILVFIVRNRYYKWGEAEKYFKKGNLSDAIITDKKKIGGGKSSITFYFFDNKKEKIYGTYTGEIQEGIDEGDIIPILYMPANSSKYLLPTFAPLSRLSVKENGNWDIDFQEQGGGVYIRSVVLYLLLFFSLMFYIYRITSKLSRGYSIDFVTDRSGRTLLMHTINRRQYKLAKLLIEKKAALNASDNRGNTPLLLATHYYNAEIVNKLIEAGADINAGDKKGITPLINAIKGWNYNGVYLLVAKGADVNKPDNMGNTPLMHAIRKNNIVLINFLISKGADIHRRSSDSRTTLMHAISYSPNAVNILIDKGARISDVNHNGSNALIYTVRTKMRWYSRYRVVRLLLSKGAKINFKDKFGVTALMYAAAKSSGLVRILLSVRGIDVNIRDNSLKTALIHAAIKEKRGSYCLNGILEKGGKINAQDKLGMTALMYAAYKGNYSSVLSLLRRGANRDIKDKNNMSALSHARKKIDNQSVIKLLENPQLPPIRPPVRYPARGGAEADTWKSPTSDKNR